MIDTDEFSLNINVGDATYWSEITAIQTADALFSKGIITDAVTYLESLPKGYVHNLSGIIKQLKEDKQKQEEALLLQQEGNIANIENEAPEGVNFA